MNAISTNLGNFQVTRVTVNKKTGVETFKVRDALGVLASGNRKERDAAVRFLVIHYYTTGQFRALSVQLERAFGKGFTGSVPPGFNIAAGTMSKEGNTWGLSNRQAWDGIVGAILKMHEEKPFKGERALFCTVLADAVATFKAQQEQAAAQAEAEKIEREALLAAGLVEGVVNTTAVEVQAPALPAPDGLVALFDADDKLTEGTDNAPAEGTDNAPAEGTDNAEGTNTDGDGFAAPVEGTDAERVNADAEVIA